VSLKQPASSALNASASHAFFCTVFSFPDEQLQFSSCQPVTPERGRV
jgi:hypothetical protein